jgi:hypothetical protein
MGSEVGMLWPQICNNARLLPGLLNPEFTMVNGASDKERVLLLA